MRAIPRVASAAAILLALSAPAAQAALPIGYSGFVPDTVTAGHNCDEDSKDLSGCEHAAKIVKAIKEVPCSSKEVVRATVFNMNFPAYADAAVKSIRCGVEWRVLTWHGKDDDGSTVAPGPELLRIRDAIRASRRGSFTDCKNSCYSNAKNDSLHWKEWMFSHTGGLSNVVLHDENNATIGGDSRMFGSTTVVADACLYKGMTSWFDKGRSDKPRKAPKPVKSCNGKRVVHFTPTEANAALGQLQHVKRGTSCRVSYDMFQTTLRAPVKELERLHPHCSVRAIVDWTKIAGPEGSKAQQTRIREMVSAGIKTRDASWRLPTYNHRKSVLTQASVSSGATNQTKASFKSANAIMISTDAADVKAAWKASDYMWGYSKTLTMAAVGCTGKKQPAGC